MFDLIDEREYEEIWALEEELRMWVEMMEESARIRVNVELRELSEDRELLVKNNRA